MAAKLKESGWLVCSHVERIYIDILTHFPEVILHPKRQHPLGRQPTQRKISPYKYDRMSRQKT